jgi:hypothetical protein
MTKKFTGINICSDFVNERMIFIYYPQAFIWCVKSRSCHLKTQDPAHSLTDIWWTSSVVPDCGVCWNRDKKSPQQIDILGASAGPQTIQHCLIYIFPRELIDGERCKPSNIPGNEWKSCSTRYHFFSFRSASSNFYRNCMSSCTNDCESGINPYLDIHLLISYRKHIE